MRIKYDHELKGISLTVFQENQEEQDVNEDLNLRANGVIPLWFFEAGAFFFLSISLHVYFFVVT